MVHSSAEFDAALDACRREALKSFGDESVMVEKFVERPRFVEGVSGLSGQGLLKGLVGYQAKVC